ncbi:MAG TPA: FeoA family protein [Spirochaetota bacterium]|nr:FeoA family protein [Spirochaetota bacterium]HOM38283.1 FeoA family protein [Spirochaetota bacterium]HPQ48499.1 FeoA family protein [Spirochaetota bacterium]
MFIIDVPEGSEVVIKEIIGGKGFISKILSLGIRSGDKVKVIQNRKGPIIIVKDSIKIALGHGTGKKIIVEECNKSGED